VVLETESFVLLQNSCETRAKTICEDDLEMSFKGSHASGCGLHSHTCVLPFRLDSLLNKACVEAVLLRAMSDGKGYERVRGRQVVRNIIYKVYQMVRHSVGHVKW